MKDKLFSILKALYQMVIDQWQRSHNNYLQQQAVQQQALLNSCITAIADQMAADLYQAFHRHSYPNLQPLYSPLDIRFIRCWKQNGCYMYQFSLNKSNQNKIAFCVLQNLQQDMNTDLASTCRELAHLYGLDYLCCTHPFLYYGIYVTAVQDFNLAQTVITVQTHLTPQIFLQQYRQTL